VLAVVGGFLNVPHSLHWLGPARFSNWLQPLLYQVAPVHAGHGAAPAIEYGLMAWATFVWAPGAMLLAWWIYGKDPAWGIANRFVTRFPKVFEWVNAKYYVDEFYEWALIGPCKQLGAQLWAFDTWVVDGMVNGAARATVILAHASFWVDAKIVDRTVDLVADLTQWFSAGLKVLQSGRVQNYAFVMFIGFLVFAFWRFLA
jgi:NADH-quinone oxidoreductase subunit L